MAIVAGLSRRWPFGRHDEPRLGNLQGWRAAALGQTKCSTRSPYDDAMPFDPAVIKQVIEETGPRCAAPFCRRALKGPGAAPYTDGGPSASLGEGAHIAGAQPGTARYRDLAQDDPSRHWPINCIWLCRNCHRLVDRCEMVFTSATLHQWKRGSSHSWSLETTMGPGRYVVNDAQPYETRNRAVLFFERHRNLAAPALGLLRSMAVGRPAVPVPRELEEGVVRTEALIAPFGPDRDDYIYESSIRARQQGMVELALGLKNTAPFHYSRVGEQTIDLRFHTDENGERAFSEIAAQILVAHYLLWADFMVVVDNVQTLAASGYYPVFGSV